MEPCGFVDSEQWSHVDLWICGFVDCGFGAKSMEQWSHEVEVQGSKCTPEQWSHVDLWIWGFGAMRIWGFEDLGSTVQNMMKLGSKHDEIGVNGIMESWGWGWGWGSGEIELNDTFHTSNWKSWFLTFLDLYRPWMTLYVGKSYISENYMKNRVEWYPTQLNLINLNFVLSWALISIS